MAAMLSVLQEEKGMLLVCLERERMKNEEALVKLLTLEKERGVLLRRESALETAGKVQSCSIAYSSLLSCDNTVHTSHYFIILDRYACI